LTLGRTFPFFLASLCLCAIGCHSTIDVRIPRDPCGGLLTNSEACFYDFDQHGFWYVIFLQQGSLGLYEHRHAAGHHLMLTRAGDIVFFSRCSGRAESIDIMGKFFPIKEGQVFLVRIDKAQTQIVQLPAQSKPFDGKDPSARADALAALIGEPVIQEFLSSDARQRIAKDAAAQKQKQQGGTKKQ
jgi:hypothetical protein